MRRLPFIDSLRGIAAIYVVMYHMTLLPTPNLVLPHWASTTVLNGGTAVTLFFIVSAFSLCHTMPGHIRDGVAAFYIRRFFRIAPLFYFMMAAYILKDYHLRGVSHSAAEVIENALFMFNFIPGEQSGFVWASWTIGVEMLFYLIFPVIYLYAKDYYQIAVLLLLSLCIPVVVQEILYNSSLSDAQQSAFLQTSIFRHLPIFISGVAIHAIFDRQIFGKSRPAAFGVALSLGAVYLYHAMMHGALNIILTDFYYWQGPIYGCLIIGLGIYPSALLVNRATLYCGKVSYSIYLAHPSIIVFLSPLYRAIYRLPIPTTLMFVTAAAATLCSVIVVATMLYRFVERPGMNLGHRVLLMRAQRAALSPTPS